MATQHMLTTFDNPFSPFDEFDAWRVYDESHQYNTLSLLARIAVVSPDVSEADEALAIEDAIDEIVRENVTGMFRKVSKEFPDDPEVVEED